MAKSPERTGSQTVSYIFFEISLILTSFTIPLFSKLQNFRKYFINGHFFRKISKDLSNFESIFEKNVNFESIFENFVNFESIFEKNVNFEKFVNGK